MVLTTLLRRVFRRRRPPVLFLDIDGVLAPFEHRQPEMVPISVGGWQGTVLVSPPVLDKIRVMHETGLIEVRWLTSWDEDAPDLFAPATGLGAYTGYPEPSTGAGYWKENVVRTHAASGRPFIWVDDEMADYPSCDQFAIEVAGHGLFVAPDPRTGLAMSDLDAIETFARAASVR